MKNRVVTVFGGSGFLGRHLVQRLAAAGAAVRVAVRDVEAANFLKVLGDTGQVVPWPADVTEPAQVAQALDGASEAVNLVGILYERGRRTFQRVHADGAGNVARAAKAAGVKSLVHVSAIGADANSESAYARTKAAGEAAVRAAFPAVTILRPSVVFGPEDNFFNMFAGLMRLTPVLPVFGCPTVPKVKLFPEGGLIDIDLYGSGGTRFQPVYVGDVVRAFLAALDSREAAGKRYDLCGPREYTLRDLLEQVCRITGRRRLIVGLPDSLSYLQAWTMEFMPVTLLTRDNYDSMQVPSVCDCAFPFGIQPVALETAAPAWLAPAGPRERYPQLRWRARR